MRSEGSRRLRGMGYISWMAASFAPSMLAGLALSALALSGVALSGAAAAGCSGATEQDVLRTNSAASSGGTEADASSGGGGGQTGSSGGADASSPDGAAGTCTPEVEPNDDDDDANELAPSRCGAIQPNSEVDTLRFELSDKSTSMQLRFDGKVTLEVEVDGDKVLLGGPLSPKVPFIKGKRYTVRIKSTERATSVPWRVDLIEK